MPSSRVLGVGVFVIGGLLLFGTGLFLIGDRRGLFNETFEVYAEFTKLAGLENGATVRVAGLDAGEVTSIRVPTGPAGRFRVRLRVREDLHGVVRGDSVASIQNEGLVGNKFIQIEAGSEQSPRAPDGSTIQSRDPVDIADLLNQMSDTLTMVTDTIEVLRVDVQKAIVTLTGTAGEAQALLADAREDVDVIMTNGRRVAQDMRSIMDSVAAGKGTVGRLIHDDRLYEDARRIAREVEGVVANLREVASQARQAVADFNGTLTNTEGPARGLAADLRQTITQARDAMGDLAESAEALKRNFLLRGYFNRRGYFDLDDVEAEAYRNGALETDGRRALRLWLDAKYLFSTDARGVEQLTDEGRARVESAMSQFLQYPPNAPLVIEGYAEGATEAARYVAARHRAALVRDHLVSRFSLDPNRAGIIALGHEAPQSPTGATWNGVALALFAPR